MIFVEKYDIVENGSISMLILGRARGDFLPHRAFRTFKQIPLKLHWNYGDKVSHKLDLHCHKHEITFTRFAEV